jgi:hypothetical protein
MVAVDRAQMHGLPRSRDRRHGVHRHASVDPGRRVAREQVVGQRRDRELVGGRDRVDERAGLERQLLVRDAAHEHRRQVTRRQLVQPPGHALTHPAAEACRSDRGRDDLLARRVDGQRLGQQSRKLQHLDSPLRQRVGEGIVLLPGPLDPEHVVEEQLVLVPRGEPLERGARAAQDDPAKAAHLGVDSEVGGRGSRRGAHRPVPMVTRVSTSIGGIGCGAAGASRCWRHLRNTYTGVPAIRSRKPLAMISSPAPHIIQKA